VSDRLAVLLQYLLPKKALTAFAGWCAASRATGWTRRVIPWFIQRYGVNMAEAANPDPASYASFNEFFTRPLRPGVRPLADADWVCPVDGAISQFGPIEKTRSSRPRATTTAPARWWAATRRWRRSSRTATSPPST
jgi:phosphatidylserine decarboxylase